MISLGSIVSYFIVSGDQNKYKYVWFKQLEIIKFYNVLFTDIQS